MRSLHAVLCLVFCALLLPCSLAKAQGGTGSITSKNQWVNDVANAYQYHNGDMLKAGASATVTAPAGQTVYYTLSVVWRDQNNNIIEVGPTLSKNVSDGETWETGELADPRQVTNPDWTDVYAVFKLTYMNMTTMASGQLDLDTLEFQEFEE